MNPNIGCIEIKGKKIYVFDSHHYALFPWAKVRSESDEPPILLSLDHHTDTHSPFLMSCFKNNEYDEDMAKYLLKTINYNDLNSIESIILKLRNDEHIKTALESNLISKALIISYDNTSDYPQSNEDNIRTENILEILAEQVMGIKSSKYDFKRPYTYPEDKIYIPAIDEKNREEKEVYDIAIETEFINEKFDIFHQMAPDIVTDDHKINKKYILDIDLDYFHTVKSINPDNYSFFYNLIRNAEIITIARERVCVNLVKMAGENINSEILHERLIEHIQNALENYCS